MLIKLKLSIGVISSDLNTVTSTKNIPSYTEEVITLVVPVNN